ncbi:MAG TPA: sensor histidine kinase [Streptosporangiaceae bacterium]|nr:sensor histidine kinase [Streptosporangiaceae bacterium]
MRPSRSGAVNSALPGKHTAVPNDHALPGGQPADPPLRHVGLFYRGTEEYLATVARFLLDGLAAAEYTFVAIAADKAAALRRVLGGHCARITFADITELGRNPARIIPAIQAFADRAGQPSAPVRFVGEPVWPGRSAAELREAARHEALLNLAFARANLAILCPYAAVSLPAQVLADARCTHPLVTSDGRAGTSPEYAGPGVLPTGCQVPLPAPPGRTELVAYGKDLRGLRALVARRAREAGLNADRTTDLVLAVSEVAANTLVHTSAGGTARLWLTAGEIVCEVRDTGTIADPLAGCRKPDPDRPGGHGLWLVNQACDLAELRSGPRGTVIRMHMKRGNAAASEPGHELPGGHLPLT